MRRCDLCGRRCGGRCRDLFTNPFEWVKWLVVGVHLLVAQDFTALELERFE